MKDDIRCVDGRLMKHNPQYDDPDLETDCGLCPECASLRAENERLREALKESVGLQSHYAELLNMHDGGQRLPFANVEAWLDRLAALED